MSLINYMQPQSIDSSPDELMKESQSKSKDDSIRLDEQVDEEELDQFWDEVVDDIHHDPQWFNFSE